VRRLLRAPLFAASAITALALGIGANTSVFSVVYAVLLKPLPYLQPDGLVQLSERNPARPSRQATLSAGTFVDWRARSRALESLAVYAPLFAIGETVWDIGDHAAIVKTAGVSPSLFTSCVCSRFSADRSAPKPRTRLRARLGSSSSAMDCGSERSAARPTSLDDASSSKGVFRGKSSA
jgi:hypothetical protein